MRLSLSEKFCAGMLETSRYFGSNNRIADLKELPRLQLPKQFHAPSESGRGRNVVEARFVTNPQKISNSFSYLLSR